MKHQVALLVVVVALLLLSGCRPPARAQSAVHWPSALTLRGDTAVLAPGSPAGVTYVILYNEYSCKDCFTTLANALYLHDSSMGRSSESIVVARTQSGAYARRLALNSAKKLLPQVQEVYFDLVDSSEDDPWPPKHLKGGIFGTCGVSKTPSLLVLDEHSGMPVKCLTYEELFDDVEAVESMDAQLHKLVANLGVRLRR